LIQFAEQAYLMRDLEALEAQLSKKQWGWLASHSEKAKTEAEELICKQPQ
jgi:hypothetical protein